MSTRSDRVEAEPRKKRFPRWLMFALAAFWLAAAIWFVPWYVRHKALSTREPPGLIHCIAPAGAVSTFGEFRWSYALPAGGWYQLEIYDANPALTVALFVEGRLAEDKWTAPTDASARWPDSIEWKVRAFDAQGKPVEHGSATATRTR